MKQGGQNGHTNGNGHSCADSTRTEGSDHRHGNGYGKETAANEEMTRLMIQALGDMGYLTAMTALSEASGVRVESAVVSSFRQAMLAGAWEEALEALGQLQLSDPQDEKTVLFLVYEQKYLELLERRATSDALKTLRLKLTPLKHNMARLHWLSSLLMTAPDDLQGRAAWSGSSGGSRAELLRKVSRSIAPSSMMPEHRLETILDDARQTQARTCLYHTGAQSVSLLAADHQCDRTQFPLETLTTLRGHQDEVWHVVYSPSGAFLASAARDGEIILYQTATWQVKHRLQCRASTHGTGANKAVSHLAFSADEELLLACSQENTIFLWDVRTGLLLNQIGHLHKEPPSAAVFVPGREGDFLSGGLDKKVCLISASGHTLHTWHSGRIYDLKCLPDGSAFAAIDTAGTVSLYALSDYKLIKSVQLRDDLTSLSVSQDGKRLLIHCRPREPAAASTEGDRRALAQQPTRLQELSLPDLNVLSTLQPGPKQSQFVVRSCYGGIDEQFVLSGSEEGAVYIWHRRTATLLEKLGGHTGCVGSLAWRPGALAEWASASDDGTVRIWRVKESL